MWVLIVYEWASPDIYLIFKLLISTLFLCAISSNLLQIQNHQCHHTMSVVSAVSLTYITCITQHSAPQTLCDTCTGDVSDQCSLPCIHHLHHRTLCSPNIVWHVHRWCQWSVQSPSHTSPVSHNIVLPKRCVTHAQVMYARETMVSDDEKRYPILYQIKVRYKLQIINIPFNWHIFFF